MVLDYLCALLKFAKIPKFNYTTSARMFFVNSVQLWNVLPMQVKYEPDYSIFKNNLKPLFSNL